MKQALFVLFAILFSIHPAVAASFNCKKAVTDVEKSICESKELSALDERMGRLYANAQNQTKDRKRLAAEQNKWLVERNACWLDWDCLKLMYQLRIRVLESGRGAGEENRDSKGDFIITRNQDAACIPFRSNVNEFRYLDFDQCHPRLSEKYPEFSRPEWKEVPLDLAIAERAFKGIARRPDGIAAAERRWQDWLKATEELRSEGKVKMWLAEVDVDNDGVVDSIARVQYAIAASDYPILKRDCLYTHSGLWLVRAADEEKRKLFNGRMGIASDIIMSSATRTAYVLDWYEGDVGPEYAGRNIGATRGVRLNRGGNLHGPIPMCHINWVPEGSFRYYGNYQLQRP
jgi:uncharacterized protein YecT (DUF1311 family)